jgi:hypothetical protein
MREISDVSSRHDREVLTQAPFEFIILVSNTPGSKRIRRHGNHAVPRGGIYSLEGLMVLQSKPYADS